MNGVVANWMRPSLEEVGLDYATLPPERVPMPEGVKPWRDIWSAGQSVGLIDQVLPVAELIEQLTVDFERIAPLPNWRSRLRELT
jgi:nitronate monooxygenase